ncbi:MAG TPA: hypothetical protein VG759_14810 [Candidatus Angelobacter sp.]|nr:hypothetical protein [Candidatus Angelobacter sp.]
MNRRRSLASSIPDKIKAAVQRDFEDPDRILLLVGQFLNYPRYNREFFQLLLQTARGEAGECWSVRCLALALMERQLETLNPLNLPEFDEVLVSLGLKMPGEDLVAAELVGGTASMALAEFIPHLLRKMSRRDTSKVSDKDRERELADLLHRSTQECKLILGPCVFSPAEVCERVIMQVQTSDGIPLSWFAPIEKKSAGPFGLSSYECQICHALQRSNQVYWVSPTTSSRINSLVEYPLGTVALALKLPGSDVEIEIKRVGKRERPLGVLFARNGDPVPVAHRLQGGSTGWMLQAESDNESRFRSLFRAIYQKEPPLSRTLFITNIRRVPCKSGAADLLTWFMDRESFGADFEEMRSALKSCLEAGGSSVPPTPLGQTVAFLRDAKPRQSFLAGTSSFRLDRLSEYLSSLGPRCYFDDGLAIKWIDDDARQFADDLLEEVLGRYIQPNERYRTHEQYLKAAFNIPENRAAANAAYEFCMEQIGVVWGTMLAVGSFSTGESFVPRNAGLKNRWHDGDWRVRIIFMDHDCLHSPDPEQADFHAAAVMAGTMQDEIHIFGHALPHRDNIGAVTCLQEIYRTPKTVAREGMRSLRRTMLDSFCKTRRSAAGLLSPSYLRQMLNFEEVVRMSLDPRLVTKWEEQAVSWLVAKGHTEEQSREYQQAAKEHERFFREHAFLYQHQP